MFTGIVTGVGRVASFERRRGGARLRVAAPRGYGRFAAGESVSVSGVCLTAAVSGTALVADLSPETLRRSTLGRLRAGCRVHLERALRWGDRLSGHFVLGHVDAVAGLLAHERRGGCWTLRFAVPRGLSRLIVEKGSVALDGVSLTVSARRPRSFEVVVVPQTLRRTALAGLRPGDSVNVEADVFARYGRARSLARVRRAADA